jgi:Phage derived protein Gp49-like (DUF891)
MAVRWTFRSYVSPDGEDLVASWYQAQSPTVQAKFDRRLHDLRQMAPHEWREPFTKQLEGNCDGLVELRFKADRVQHRPLGFYGPVRMEFTIIFFAIEKGSRFEPADACATGIRRKNEVLQNPGRASRVIEVE